MTKLKLDKFETYQKEQQIAQASSDKIQVKIGMGSCGIAAGAKKAWEVFDKEIKAAGLTNIEILQTGCMGTCYAEPNVEVIVPGQDNVIYGGVNEEVAEVIFKKHLVNGNPFNAQVQQKTSPDIIKDEAHGDYKQTKIVLRNCGVIDPENINEYLARDGYSALKKAIAEMKPEEIVDELKTSGLRGRGGAGFPTWRKWKFTQDVKDADQKYIVCNADEGDPGAYMDRSTLEGDPHTVLEAMAIAGYTVGANQGYIYIRAEYPLAIDRLNIAIKQAKELGLLGDKILGSDFSFDIELRLGAGAFVCGEETALLASIEGERGMPKPRPPFPAIKGLWGKPTVINNVETWANIPVIINKGGKWFSSIGTEGSKGTKVFALVGKIKNSGLIEVPMGTTLRDIIYEIGDGIIDNKEFKAVQTGGPSGGVIPVAHLDTPLDYDNLQKIGSMMGSGGMIVMDEDDCMVDVTKFYLQFSVDESCGKCSPCRIGGFQLLQLLDKISKGNGEQIDLEKMSQIANAMKKASLCGLGQTAGNPILSTLNYFMDEYQAHIVDKKCPAGKCTELVTYTIDQEKCAKCSLCQRNCPADAIPGNREEGFSINQENCIKCGKCFDVCKFKAIIKA